uniref:Uncharacterized protein n=1 Tax=Anguilla anguilla TaxID=7936 RepID=A0A0E9TFX3_ANGAN
MSLTLTLSKYFAKHWETHIHWVSFLELLC